MGFYAENFIFQYFKQTVFFCLTLNPQGNDHVFF